MRTKEQLKEERDKIVKGLEETYRRLVEFKKQKNSPMIIIKDGEVVALDPHEVPPTTLYKRNTGANLT
ncbi:hypothetical protein E1163_03015 [Fulvivirga kasyanovii]|uniref:Uncharacterized protein n=2 Tax=Fulvivirgaceae TaxID=2762286 RepID=A0ABW9RKL8_9BACT|nr:hypothetical protein [Fulvivirga kasyanovii]